MTRHIFAALMMSSLCSGTGGRGIADQRLDLLAGDATNAADALIAKLEKDERSEREIYQQRRKEFEITFFELLEGNGQAVKISAVREVWKRACKQGEPEFFPEQRT